MAPYKTYALVILVLLLVVLTGTGSINTEQTPWQEQSSNTPTEATTASPNGLPGPANVAEGGQSRPQRMWLVKHCQQLS